MELFRRSFSRQVDTGYEARLRIENRNGRIEIIRHDQPNVSIEVSAHLYAGSDSEADDQLRRLQEAVIVDGNRVEIVTPELSRPEFGIFFFGRGPRVDYQLRVPADTDVQAHSRNGSVDLRGTRRPAELRSRNGSVRLSEVDSKVSVDSQNGRIEVERCAGPLSVKGGNGGIGIQHVRQRIEVQTRNGSTEITEPGGGVSVVATNGSIRYRGAVNGDIEMRATNGSIRMAVPPDSRFEIDADSVHGSVRSELRVHDRPPAEGSAPAPRVFLRTTNGSIRLTEA